MNKECELFLLLLAVAYILFVLYKAIFPKFKIKVRLANLFKRKQNSNNKNEPSNFTIYSYSEEDVSDFEKKSKEIVNLFNKVRDLKFENKKLNEMLELKYYNFKFYADIYPSEHRININDYNVAIVKEFISNMIKSIEAKILEIENHLKELENNK